jgi:hypothetical protein
VRIERAQATTWRYPTVPFGKGGLCDPGKDRMALAAAIPHALGHIQEWRLTGSTGFNTAVAAEKEVHGRAGRALRCNHF